MAACVAAVIAAHAAVLIAIGARPEIGPDRLPVVHPLWLAKLPADAPAAPPPEAPAPVPAPDATPATLALAPPATPASAPLAPPAPNPAPVVATASAAPPPLPAAPLPTADASHPAADAALLARYRPASALTRRARLAAPVDLDFKVQLHALPPPGSQLRMILLLSAEGRVDEVVVESSTLPDPFQSHALARAYGARYLPGEVDGVAVPSRVTVEVSY